MTDPTDPSLGFTTLDRESRAVELPVDGALPDWLSGSLSRTAPTRFEVGARAYEHWFDGLAMLHGFAFGDGGVRYTNRYLRSRNWCAAEAKSEIARSEFMTDPCRTLFGRVMAIVAPTSPDNGNVNVSVLGDALVALTETPMPIRFDPHTLETLGPLRYDPVVKGQVSTAHPHSDGSRGYSYVIEMGRRSVYRLFADEGGHQRVVAELPADEPSYLHSFGMSERHLILVEFPLRVNPLRLALSGKPFIANYRWKPELGTRFTVVEKETGAVVARARAPACFSFHHVNAFEADGRVHVDLLAYPDPGVIDRLRLAPLRAGEPADATALLTRFAVSLGDDGDEPTDIAGRVLCDEPVELPRFDYARRAGRAYSVLWAVGQGDAASFWDTIVRIDLSGLAASVRRWREPGCFPGEPVFVARPGGEREDDGALLSVVLDARVGRSFLLVLDAATLEERARAAVPHHIPFGFHGNHFPDPDHPVTREGAAAR